MSLHGESCVEAASCKISIVLVRFRLVDVTENHASIFAVRLYVGVAGCAQPVHRGLGPNLSHRGHSSVL